MVQEVQAQHGKQEVQWKQEMAQMTQDVAGLKWDVAKQKEAIKAS